MPLSLVANNLTLVDTVDFTVDQENVKNILEGNLFVYADNGYPFEAKIKLDLLNENQQIFKTVNIVNNTITSAPVNSSLKVVSPASSVVNIPLTSTDITELTQAKKMMITVAFTTTARPQFMKIYS